MAETDFGIFGATAADLARGVTSGFAVPSGGDTFTFGFNSKGTGNIATGLYYNATNFAPLRDDSANATGGSVRAALKRGVSVSATGFSIGIFCNLVTTTESDVAYVLGLSDNDPHSIVLAKTALNINLDQASTKILRVSSETFTWDTWLHLRLDSIVNPNGDVILKCFRNSLATHTVKAPTWVAISGMTDFVDDALGVASNDTGTPDPLAGGYAGFYFQSSKAGSRGFVDQFELYRQI